MVHTRVVITPRRSLALFALLSIFMVMASYVVILLLAISCVYLPYAGFSETGNLQLLILLCGGVVVAGTLLWSVVPRWEKFTAPGLLLQREAHPRLFSMLDEVAASLNEQLPGEVYLVGNANAFVLNAGGLMGMGSRRILAIGMPFLSMLTISEIRAVLVHEFAHYYGGDTRLGPWVYRAQKSIVLVFQNMGKIGVIARIGILQLLHRAVTKLMEWYFIIFLKVINFISRKQEFRADELACLVAGVEPMKRSLLKIHGGSLAWSAYWNTEVAPVLDQGCLPAIGDGFVRFLAAPQISVQVDKAVEDEMARGKTNPFNTHPPLNQRLAALDKMTADSKEIDARAALELLEKPEEVEREFLEFVNPKLQAKPLRPVGWDEVGQAVMIPSWKKLVQEYSSLLQGITAGTLPDELKKLPEIASQIRDPQGMLLSREQREGKASQLLSIALGLALLQAGWELEAQPGNFKIYRGQETLDIFQVVQDLTSGKMNREDWTKCCAGLGIGQLSLALGAAGGTLEPQQNSANKAQV